MKSKDYRQSRQYRNTLTLSRENVYNKSEINNNDLNLLPCVEMSNNQKFSLTLKLLQKYSQKMFTHEQTIYDTMINNHSQTNQFLSRIENKNIFKLFSTQQKKLVGSDRFLQLSRNYQCTAKKRSQNLICSWSAFEKLDITYKSRQQELMHQNNVLLEKVTRLQNKLRGMYSGDMKSMRRQKQNKCQKNEKVDQSQVAAQIQHLKSQQKQQDNILEIQKRTKKNQILLVKLKEKIYKRKQQKIQCNTLIKQIDLRYSCLNNQKQLQTPDINLQIQTRWLELKNQFTITEQ